MQRFSKASCSEGERCDGGSHDCQACNCVGGFAFCSRSKVKSTVIEGHHDPIVTVAASEARIIGKCPREFSKLSLAYGLDLLDDGPLEALGARRCRQGAVVAPVL